jgi:enamine deaminase RidA (YjgF/YER057c/UK114 family)
VTEQFDVAAGNLVTALRAAGGVPEHLVSLQVFTTNAAAYRAAMSELGAIYRRHLGRHYVATALFEVAGLFDPAARVELLGIAVIPDEHHPKEQP